MQGISECSAGFNLQSSPFFAGLPQMYVIMVPKPDGTFAPIMLPIQPQTNAVAAHSLSHLQPQLYQQNNHSSSYFNTQLQQPQQIQQKLEEPMETYSGANQNDSCEQSAALVIGRESTRNLTFDAPDFSAMAVNKRESFSRAKTTTLSIEELQKRFSYDRSDDMTFQSMRSDAYLPSCSVQSIRNHKPNNQLSSANATLTTSTIRQAKYRLKRKHECRYAIEVISSCYTSKKLNNSSSSALTTQTITCQSSIKGDKIKEETGCQIQQVQKCSHNNRTNEIKKSAIQFKSHGDAFNVQQQRLAEKSSQQTTNQIEIKQMSNFNLKLEEGIPSLPLANLSSSQLLANLAKQVQTFTKAWQEQFSAAEINRINQALAIVNMGSNEAKYHAVSSRKFNSQQSIDLCGQLMENTQIHFQVNKKLDDMPIRKTAAAAVSIGSAIGDQVVNPIDTLVLVDVKAKDSSCLSKFDFSQVRQISGKDGSAGAGEQPNSKSSRTKETSTYKANSKYHNMNKLLMYNILSMFQPENLENLVIEKPMKEHLSQIIRMLKQLSKRSSEKYKFEYFSREHYHLLFLKITKKNIGFFSTSERDHFLHLKCFQVDLKKPVSEIDFTYMNMMKAAFHSVFLTSIRLETIYDDNSNSKQNLRRQYCLKAIRGIEKLQAGEILVRF